MTGLLFCLQDTKRSLGGGFKHSLCSPLFGEDSHFDYFFSDGLVQPPTGSTLDLMKYFVYLLPFVSIIEDLGKNRKATTPLLLDQISGFPMYTYVNILYTYKINSHSSCDVFHHFETETSETVPGILFLFETYLLSGETDLQKSASAPGLSALQFKCLG